MNGTSYSSGAEGPVRGGGGGTSKLKRFSVGWLPVCGIKKWYQVWEQMNGFY